MKKRLFTILTVFALIMCLLPFSATANDEISVYLNGNKLSFNVNPQIIDGRTMVPMRGIFEAFGAKVQWSGDTQTINAEYVLPDGASSYITMQINSSKLIKDSKEIILDVAPVIIDGSTLVPVRAVAEALDANVQWSDKNKCVSISTNGMKAFKDFPDVPQLENFFSLDYIRTDEESEKTIFYYKLNGNLDIKDLKEVFSSFGYSAISYDDTELSDAILFEHNKNGTCVNFVYVWDETKIGAIKEIRVEITSRNYGEISPSGNDEISGSGSTVRLFNEEGNVIFVEPEKEEELLGQGWQKELPYLNRGFSIKKATLMHYCTDIYGEKTIKFDGLSYELYNSYVKINVVDFEQSGGQVTNLIFDYNGGQYKISFDTFKENLENDSIKVIPIVTEDMVTLYKDFYIKKVLPNSVEQHLNDGWSYEFSYYGREQWFKWIMFSLYIEDQYGSTNTISAMDLPTWNKITFQWFDDDEVVLDENYTGEIKTLYFDFKGGLFKITTDKLEWAWLRGYVETSNPSEGISAESWSKIQQGIIWIGMTKKEFRLVEGEPDDINYYNYGYGETEQWVYEYSNYDNDYYYFRDGRLSSWQT